MPAAMPSSRPDHMMARKVSHSSTYSGLESFLCGEGGGARRGARGGRMTSGTAKDEGSGRRPYDGQEGEPQQHVFRLGQLLVWGAGWGKGEQRGE